MSDPGPLLDPICDMVVSVAAAREAGLTLEMPDREYAFCSPGCQGKFAKAPHLYRAKVDAWLAAEARGEHAGHAHSDEMPIIDEGIRRWYASCRCCLSETYPKVVEMLDQEKAAAGH